MILTDLQLPDASGGDVVRRICRNAVKVPLIVLTDLDDEKVELNALKDGAQDFLVKSKLDPVSLMKAILHSIERKQLDWQLRVARRRLRILHDAASKLEVCSMKKQAYKLTIDSTKLLLPNSMCQIFVEKNSKLIVTAASPELSDRIGRKISLDFGLAGMTFAENRTFHFESHEDMPMVEPKSETFKSGVSIPLGKDAVFQCVSNEPSAFTTDDINMLEMLAGHLTGTVERISLERKLRNLAIHDPLTGAFNRNFFQVALNREKARAERYKSKIGFLMIDIDHFKEINDIHGHLMGDRILREVAAYLAESIRETDYLIRYGGDEFLMILIEAGQTAVIVKDRILKGSRLAEKSTKLIGNPVTLSIGHAHWDPESGISIRETLAKADRSMYNEKRKRK